MSSRVPRLKVPVYREQRERVLEAIDSGALASGPHLGELQERLEDRFGARVVLTSSGFNALWVTLMALKESRSEPQPRIALPAAGTCFAIVNAAWGAGWAPTLTDLELETLSLSEVSDVESAVVPHHFGRKAAFRRPSESFSIVDDAAQSFLSFDAVPDGSRAMIASFYPTKGVNGVAGGAILTRDRDLGQRCAELSDYSRQDAVGRLRVSCAMTNLNAAFLLGTLERIDELRDGLKSHHERLAVSLGGHPDIEVMPLRAGDCPTRMIVTAASPEIRESWVAKGEALGVECGRELLRLWPVNSELSFPRAIKAIDTVFSIPLWPTMEDSDLSRVEQFVRQSGDRQN
jgi:dTDP-4-amino-4,6-dideoxygalactose transaminase